MKQNIQSFDIRWSDLDPNRHVANSSFVDLMSEARMQFLAGFGFTQQAFSDLDFGPVVLWEEFHYLKEMMAEERIHIETELLANSPDYKFMRFAHCAYNSEGKMAVYSEITFSWMDLQARKLMPPPEPLQTIFSNMPKASAYAPLNAQDLRSPKVPKKCWNYNNKKIPART